METAIDKWRKFPSICHSNFAAKRYMLFIYKDIINSHFTSKPFRHNLTTHFRQERQPNDPVAARVVLIGDNDYL
jgi:hypothetical protein